MTVEDHGPLEELIDAQQAGIPLSLLLLDKLKARFGTIQDVSLDENHATIILGKFARSDPMLSSQAASSMKSSGGLTNRSRQVQMKFIEICINLHYFCSGLCSLRRSELVPDGRRWPKFKHGMFLMQRKARLFCQSIWLLWLGQLDWCILN